MGGPAAPKPAGAPAPPPGGGAMTAPNLCSPNLSLCGEACIDLQHNSDHCGSCNKHCGKDKSVCVSGKCEKAKDAPAAMNDVAGLARLLALFGFGLDDLANVVGVGVDDLATTPITLADLAVLGINESALGLLGLGLDTLALVGIRIALK
jgi:hypothetical protein